LLSNGGFDSDLSGWIQSEVNESMADGLVFDHVSEDASQLACSGSMLLVSWESTASSFAEQCVLAGVDNYVASARAFLVANAGFTPAAASLTTTSVEPAYVSLELAALSTPDCSGTPLDALTASPILDPVLPSWQSMTVQLAAPDGTRSLRLRTSVVLPASNVLRAARWDNVVLHPL
jgi:hypothetical protein